LARRRYPSLSSRFARDPIRYYFGRFQPYQLALVKEIHLFTQQFWLEDNFWRYCEGEALQGIEKLKITLRRGDWWNNEGNHPLAITPHRPGMPNASVMKEDWKKEIRGEVILWDPKSWGSSLRLLKSLKELEMEFVTYDYKKSELEEIVRHAVKWQFPMDDLKVLRNDDGLAGVKTSSWRGPPCGWKQCPQCRSQGGDCKFCDEMAALKSEGKGPLLIVKSGLRWKLAPATV
jgi:hypothetical protein